MKEMVLLKLIKRKAKKLKNNTNLRPRMKKGPTNSIKTSLWTKIKQTIKKFKTMERNLSNKIRQNKRRCKKNKS